MDDTLNKAYKIIFGEDPKGLEDWEIAKKVIENFNVPKLGEDFSEDVIFRVVNHTDYPSKEIATRVVGKAEALASELFDDLPDEPHMNELYYKENKKFFEK